MRGGSVSVIPAKRRAEREITRGCYVKVLSGFPPTRFALAGMTAGRLGGNDGKR